LIFSLLKVRKKTGATIGGLIIGGTCLGGLIYWQDINFIELMSIFTALIVMMILIILIAIICNGVLILVRKTWKG